MSGVSASPSQWQILQMSWLKEKVEVFEAHLSMGGADAPTLTLFSSCVGTGWSGAGAVRLVLAAEDTHAPSSDKVILGPLEAPGSAHTHLSVTTSHLH